MQTFTLPLPCKLNPEQIQQSVTEMGELSKMVAVIAEMEKKYAEEITSLRAANKEKMAKLQKEILKGIGIRPVTCEQRVNLAKQQMYIVRLDTGKVVGKEPLTPSQREAAQPSIPGLEASQDGQNHAEVLEEVSKPE